MEYNARVELDSRDFDESAVDQLMDVVEPYGGTVARSLTGRVELIFTVPADDLRQAAATALAVARSAGHTAFSIEAMPQEEFVRRSDVTAVPPLLSVPEAADALGVSRQRALQLVNAGQLAGVKVGDTWVIPRSAVEARDEQYGYRFTGLVLPIGVLSDTGQVIEDDAVDVARQPLPVFDERENLIGLVRTVRREQDGNWSVAGTLRGLEPGTYAVAARADQLARREDGDTTYIEALRLTGINVLTTREPSFPQARIEVLPERSYLDLKQLEPEPAEVFTYQ